MIKFNLPKDLNAEQLVNEIASKGIAIDESVLPLVDGNQDFWLPVNEIDRTAVAKVIADHKPVFIQPTIQDRLAAAGISIDDLKAALGL
jgi:hypothetical protein